MDKHLSPAPLPIIWESGTVISTLLNTMLFCHMINVWTRFYLSKLTRITKPIIWNATGTNGQHSFYQLVHQGTQPGMSLVPCRFRCARYSLNLIEHSKHHRILLSNFFAQPVAVAFERTEADANEALVKSKVFEGNRPST